MPFVIESSLLSNMDTLLRYQNNLLIRKIAEERKWPLDELKKFLPKKQKIKLDQETEFSTDENSNQKSNGKIKRSAPNFKIIKKKVIKKKVVKKDALPAADIVAKLKSEASKNKKIIKKSKPKKKIIKKITKSLPVPKVPSPIEDVKNEGTILEEPDYETLEVRCILYQEKEFYLDPGTDKIYDIGEEDSLIFVGMLEGDQINFDAESAED